ncbi:MAG: purine-cytosine permease family protein [Streptosporangiaceae bacterium]
MGASTEEACLMSLATPPVLPRGIEVRSIDWIPENERHGRLWHQPMFWFLGDFQFVTISLGFVGPSLGLSIAWTFLAGFLGTVIGTFFMAFHGSQGPKMGLPQMIQSRAQFGYRGVIIPLFCVLFTYIVLNVIGQVSIAEGMSQGYGVNADVAALVTAVLATLLAIFGHDWLHRAFRTILYITLPLMAIISIGILTGNAGPAIRSHAHYGFSAAGFMVVVGAALSYNVSYAVYVSDYSRYLPRKTRSGFLIGCVFVGAAASPTWLIPLGAWLAVHLGATDALVGLKSAGNNVVPYLGTVTGLLSVVALVAVTAMNGYGASLTILTGIDCFKKIRPNRLARIATIIAAAIIWYVIGATVSGSAVNALNTGLTLMLYLLIPWTATNLVDYFLVRKGHYAITNLFTPSGIYGAIGWRGLAAFFIGFAAEIPFMVLGSPINYTGPAASALSGVDISWVAGLLVTALVYWVASRSLDLRGELPAIAASDQALRLLDTSAADNRPVPPTIATTAD